MTRINNIKSYIKTTGFTLMELMLVVAIIGTLAAISYPMYQDYIIKTRRVEAEGLMLEATSFIERSFTETGTYVGVALPFTTSPKDGGNAQYNLAYSAGPTATSYTISATPLGNQAAGDTECAVISIDQAAKKCILGGSKCSDSGTAAVREAVADCW